MKSFKLTGLRAMGLVDVPDPDLERPTDVLIRMGAVGVCGSDIHYYTTGRIGCQVVEFPFAVGHECAGTVAAIGSAVQHVRVGDRIAIEPAMTCGRCDQCLAGRENTCRHNRFLGCPGQAEGSLSQFLVMPEENCFKITDAMSLGEATVSEPLAIAIYAVRQARVTAGARIGILGMGPIGRTVHLAASDAGCGPVYATDLIDERCAAARRAGCDWVGNPRQESVVAAILEREPLGLDVVFECCGQQAALDDAVEILRPGGTLAIIGIPEVDRISFNPETIRRREITIVNIRRQRGCVQAALDLIARRPAAVRDLITHHFAFQQSDAAFDLVANYRDGVVKAMIEFE
ncbi:MAG: alcohol dehydrogenase catalytic domain-containing protein [Pirellulales bacterium]